MFDIAVPAMIGVALIVVLGIVFTILYKRATRDEAFVRTGLGGKKVVLDGGAMILPIFHSYASVNLKTLRLTVERKERESLITKDRLRVDIVAELYVRVRPDDESIALASQTLGALTNDAEALRNQGRGKIRRRPAFGGGHHVHPGVAGEAQRLRQACAGDSGIGCEIQRSRA
ncbi:putative membrane protein YqiK [Bradyrhizobium sp. i1.4.4]